MTDTKEKVQRRFLGVTPTPEKPMLNSFDKAHLKAYLKGKTHFRHGFVFTPITGKQASIHKVKQEFYNSKGVVHKDRFGNWVN